MAKGHIGIPGKISLWPLLALGLLLPVTSSLKIQCLEGWTGFSESPFCYRFFDKEETWHDAKLSCSNLGSNLVTIKSKPVLDFLATTIGELSGAQITRNWWIGFYDNNETGSDEWIWLDKKPIDTSVTPWAPNFPKIEKKGCGELNQKGKLENEVCEETKFYACERPIGAPVVCAEGWEHHAQSCYKRYHRDPRNYEDALAICQDQDSHLVIINSFTENKYIYDMANRDQVDVWLGIRENGTHFVWVDGTADGMEGVVSNWDDSQPVYEHGLNAGYMASSSKDKWSTGLFIHEHGFVCEKPKGDFCQFETLAHDSSCYEFELALDMTHDWETAEKFCTDFGMHLLTVEDVEENDWLINYFWEAMLSEDLAELGIWMGYKETSINSHVYRRITDGMDTDSDEVFTDFAENRVEDDTVEDALYMRICSQEEVPCLQTWYSHPVRPTPKLVACEFTKGTTLDISGSMHPKIVCPEGWGGHFSGNCYLPVFTESTWAEAQAFCKDNNTEANLVSMISDYENDFVTQVASSMGDVVWMGLSDRFSEGHWIWADGSETKFTMWNIDEPNGGKNENCGEFRFGGWNDHICTEKRPFICKVKGKESGDPILPETTTVPPSTNCGYGSDWVEDPNTGMCYHFIEELLTWVDAKEECRLRGGFREHGDLASINSFQEQIFLNTYLVASGSGVQHWIGLNDLNSHQQYKWSDGTPVSYVNWNDGEPNFDYENCAEIMAGHGGYWNDVSCSNNQPAICEKRGRNFIEPPTPTPPAPTCAEGWVMSMDRCYYFSQSKDEMAANMTVAAEKCKSLHAGANLVSIRDKAEQDFIYAHISLETYLGATDADVEGTWTWMDGSAWDFELWGDQEPNGGINENCADMAPNYQGMNWNDVACDLQMYFVCTYDSVVCPQHWHLYDGSCWHMSNGEVTSWQAARDTCKETSSKADLASIHRHAENWFISREVADSSWVGLTREAGDEAFKWVDNTNQDFDNTWAVGEPDQADNQLCGAVYKDETWKSDYCDEEKEFACKLKSTHYYNCPSGWEKYDGFCYLVQREELTWTAARDSCIDRGGNLVSILSEAEAGFIKSFAHYTQKCPEGWTSDDVMKMCYYLSQTAETNWYESRQKCLELDAQLIEIKTEEKSKRLQALGLQIPGFWAGASDVDKENIWKWVAEDEQISFSNWNHMYSEPNGMERENCLEVYGDNFLWNDNFCNDTFLSYICEKPQQDLGLPNPDKWIGLNDLTAPQSFAWSDGSYVSFTNWGSGMPNRHPDDTRSCNFMAGNDELWYHTECSFTLHSICKKAQDITDIPPDVYGCSEEQVEYEASCYQLHYRSHDYMTAQAACSENGGHLLTINDEFEQARIVSILGEAPELFHIGLKYNSRDQDFQWASGEPVTYTNWGAGQPDLTFDDELNGKCVNLMDERALGYWFVDKCSDQHSYICEYPRQGYTTPPPPTTTTPVPEAKCYDYAWTKYNDHCYRLFSKEFTGVDPRNFADARAYCQTFGADLVVIQDTEEMEAIKGMWINDNAWIGLRENPGEGYSWVDGTPLDYINWDTDYPDSHDGVDTCVMTLWTGAWVNYHCDHLMTGWICEVVAGTEQPTTAPPPTDAPDIDCHDGQSDGWLRMPGDDSFCYKFEAESVSWHEAKERCLSEDSRLTSIHSPAENSFIIMKISSKSVAESWIGLNDLNIDNSFEWHDESPADFFYWAPNEPSNFEDMESCGLIYTYGQSNIFGKWNDANCGIKRGGFSCKKPREGGWTTPKPTPPPEGHCPADHTELNGVCYIIQGLNQPATWSDARDACKSLGKGYNLASVHSHQQNAQLGAMIAEAAHEGLPNYWTGLHSLNIRTVYFWSDETHSDYFLWGKNQPDQTYYESCIQMYGNNNGDELSHWDDIDCDTILPYICQIKASTEQEHPPPVQMCSDPDHSDFVNFEGECYYWVEQAKTWQEAEEECVSKKSHLASINTIGSQLFLFNAMHAENAWIGLSNKKTHKNYEWSDGQWLVFAAWAEGSPMESDDDVCVSYNTNDGLWYPNPCTGAFPFMCKYSDKPIPTESPFGRCPEGFQDFGHDGFCYSVQGLENTYTSWADANLNCMGLGGHLVSIHSDQDNSLIHGIVKKTGYNLNSWIGLLQKSGGSYVWSDGTPFDGYDAWEEGEPNRDDEKCVEMQQSNAKWNDLDCDTYFPHIYICQAKRIPAEPTTTPVTHSPTMSGETTSTTTTPGSHTSHTGPTTTRSTTTRSTTTTTRALTPGLKSSGLGSGAIAGIVVSSMLAIGITIALFLLRKFSIQWQEDVTTIAVVSQLRARLSSHNCKCIGTGPILKLVDVCTRGYHSFPLCKEIYLTFPIKKIRLVAIHKLQTQFWKRFDPLLILHNTPLQ